MVSYCSEKREECGIIAIFSKKGEDVAPLLYRALMALQHRGQDAAGFAVSGERGIEAKRGLGLVSDIFAPGDMRVKGAMGIGHTRYPTTATCKGEDVQPSVFDGIAVTHNGHLANYDEVRASLESKGYSFAGTVDSEPIAYLLHSQLKEGASLAENVMDFGNELAVVHGQPGQHGVQVLRDVHRGFRHLIERDHGFSLDD